MAVVEIAQGIRSIEEGGLTINSPRYRIDQRIHELLQIHRERGFLDHTEANERVYLRSIARRQQRAVLRRKN